MSQGTATSRKRDARLFRALVEVGFFSAMLNLLLLIPPLYMLQVYDRVLPASSFDTLVYLSILAVGGLGVLGALEIVRSLYGNRVAARLDRDLGATALVSILKGTGSTIGDIQPLRDLSTVRNFISSRVVFFLFDLPFGPVFIALLYLVHPLLFWVTTSGAIVMLALALLNQWATAGPSREYAERTGGAMNTAQYFARSAETVRALGMVGNTVEFWGRRFGGAIASADRVARVNAYLGGLSRTLRMVLQLAVLGVGAWLVLGGQITAGMIFASSIIAGRALQPLDQVVGSWRQIVDASRAWRRISTLLDGAVEPLSDIALPRPSGALVVDQLIYFPPGADPGSTPLIKRVSFSVAAGEILAIVGPSRAGKSTLARLIVGAIRPRSGTIRLDGTDIANWDPDTLGRHVGYLSQGVDLLPGTIAENVSRFAPEASDEAILKAAERAHAHQLIVSQKNGYQTHIGAGDVRLSGGERQRIGLARAFWGDPALVVLDEPNANLDAEGEAALERAINDAKERRATVILITHRPSIAQKCDRILMLRDGQVEMLGTAADVMARLQPGLRPASAPAAQPVNLSSYAAARRDSHPHFGAVNTDG